MSKEKKRASNNKLQGLGKLNSEARLEPKKSLMKIGEKQKILSSMTPSILQEKMENGKLSKTDS